MINEKKKKLTVTSRALESASELLLQVFVLQKNDKFA